MSEHIGVVGAGVIGQSWAALFAARGHVVRISDPRPDLRESLAAFLPNAIPEVVGFEGDVDEAVARVRPAASTAEAVDGAVAVQEAAPERAEFKQRLWFEIEETAAPSALLLSSSSGIVASEQARRMREPLRLVIGHPFNPPHALPLVEVCAAPGTPEPTVNAAMDFYRALGKHPVRLRREVPGFVANRLQIALIDEAVRLVCAGVVDPRQLDEIMRYSLGIRWAAVGPLLGFHLGGGQGGLRHILEHVGVGLSQDIGQPDALNPDVIADVSAKTNAAYPLERRSEFAAQRDRRQAAIMRALGEQPLSVR